MTAPIVVGKSTAPTGLSKRASLILRGASPKSPVAGANAFESVEGSDEDVDVNENVNSDAAYLQTNGNTVYSDALREIFHSVRDTFMFCLEILQIFTKSVWTSNEQGPESANANANGEKVPIKLASLIRSHSVSGDLHGVQPDPVAADILRKEPEQETFVRLRISPYGIHISSLVYLCYYCYVEINI